MHEPVDNDEVGETDAEVFTLFHKLFFKVTFFFQTVNLRVHHIPVSHFVLILMKSTN